MEGKEAKALDLLHHDQPLFRSFHDPASASTTNQFFDNHHSLSNLESPVMPAMFSPYSSSLDDTDNYRSIAVSHAPSDDFSSFGLPKPQNEFWSSSQQSSLNLKQSSMKPLGFASLNISNSAPATPVVPEPPCYIESSTSFVSFTECVELFARIASVLRSLGADFEQNQNEWMMQAVITENATTVKFAVHMYKCPNEFGRSIVEFQKINGCCMAFAQLYRNACDLFGADVDSSYDAWNFDQSGLTESMFCQPSFEFIVADSEDFDVPSMQVFEFDLQVDDGSLPDLASLSPAAFLGKKLPSEDVKLTADSFETLYEMAASPMEDVQQEAMDALARASECPENQRVIVESDNFPQLLELFAKVLTIQDSDTGRCAAKVLSNLAHQQQARAQLIQRLNSVMGAVLDQQDSRDTWASLSLQDAKRQIAHALAQISETHAREIRTSNQSIKLISSLRKHSQSSDERTQNFARAALAQIAV